MEPEKNAIGTGKRPMKAVEQAVPSYGPFSCQTYVNGLLWKKKATQTLRSISCFDAS